MIHEHWFWIGGWGISPKWLQEELEKVMPNAAHTVVPPTPEAFSKYDSHKFSHIGGYSLGAFLLLQNAEKIPDTALLLAPFFAYPVEENLGGKISRTQIRYLLRWLRRSPLEALNDFYQRAKLDLPTPVELPYSFEDLEWGLMQLENERVSPLLPQNWHGIIGDDDPLLNPAQLAKIEPRLQTAPTVGHDPAKLLAAFHPK